MFCAIFLVYGCMLCLVRYLFVISTSVIDCLGRFVHRNDVLCVEWDIKPLLNSNSNPPRFESTGKFVLTKSLLCYRNLHNIANNEHSFSFDREAERVAVVQ